jgi:hypothetical protein
MNLGPLASTPYISERDPARSTRDLPQRASAASREESRNIFGIPKQAGHCLPVDTRQRKPSSPELHAGLFDDVAPKLGL